MNKRRALPIFWCFSDKARGKLASNMTELPPAPDLVDWATGEPPQSYWPSQSKEKEFATAEDLFREMSKPPHHPKRVT